MIRKPADERSQWGLELCALGVKTHWSCGTRLYGSYNFTCCCCKSIYVTCFGSIEQKEKKKRECEYTIPALDLIDLKVSNIGSELCERYLDIQVRS